MRIAIDGYEANVPQRLGSSQVAYELLKSLEKIDRKNDYTILLPEEPLDDLPKEREGWRYKLLKPKTLWTKIALPLFLFSNKKKIDLFFSPTHYLPQYCPTKKIVTIFDLSFLHFPDMFEKGDLWKLTNWTKYSIQSADWIVTISNSTKKDIISKYKISKNKITVAYPGYNKDIFKPKEKKLKDNYIIYIGTIQPRKNLVRLIEAVSRIDNLKLKIVGKTKGEGKKGWLYQDSLNAPKDFGIEDRVEFLGFVPTEDLPELISESISFIQPSLYEGFGIPVLEAMACGVPVLVSNVSSLPEIVGKAGFTFDPYSIDQMEQAIRTISSDGKLRQKYSKLGLKRVKKFSWGKMAKTVLKVFEQTTLK